jgi:RNA 2',3'-cyclic 3'-phosphodiesterase
VGVANANVLDMFYRIGQVQYSLMNGRFAGVDRLFFAVVPDAAVATDIHRRAKILQRAHQLRGRLIEPECLHVSLFFLGGLPERSLQRACEAAADLRMEFFEVSFDRSVSFLGKPGSRPFVLVGDDGLRQLTLFRRTLGAAMTRKGLRGRANSNFTPHVTLLYDAPSVEEHPIEPIRWTVNEFVLIRSVNGHTHLGRWPLRV